MQALTVTDLGVDFPHAAQVAKRCTPPHRHSGPASSSRETVYVITDLTSRQASPERIATILRAHSTFDVLTGLGSHAAALVLAAAHACWTVRISCSVG